MVISPAPPQSPPGQRFSEAAPRALAPGAPASPWFPRALHLQGVCPPEREPLGLLRPLETEIEKIRITSVAENLTVIKNKLSPGCYENHWKHRLP